MILYVFERWTSLTFDRKRLGAVEMWIWGKMITEEVRNVLEEVKEQRSLTAVIRKRETKIFGHVIRHNNFIRNILERKILGNKGKGWSAKEDNRKCGANYGLPKLSRFEEDRRKQQRYTSHRPLVPIQCSACIACLLQSYRFP